MREDLPVGDERLKRPAELFRYTFEQFARFGHLPQRQPMPDARTNHVIPIEAVADGDAQVIAARPMIGPNKLVIDLDPLATRPSVESVVASTRVRAQGDVPHVRELLMTYFADVPAPETLRRLTGLQSLFTNHGVLTKLDLDALPADQMRELAFIRWRLASFAPLERFTHLVKLRAELYREPLDPIARMTDLRFAVIRGPARGWAKLRECTQLESAAFSEIQMANLKRWNTWTELRELALSGRGLKSLAGLEASERLEELTLCNMRLDDLAPLRDLPRLRSLALRMPADRIDLESIARASRLTTLVIDHSAMKDRDLVHLPSVRPLRVLQSLEELTLMGVVIDDSDFGRSANCRSCATFGSARISASMSVRCEPRGPSVRLISLHHPRAGPTSKSAWATSPSTAPATAWTNGGSSTAWPTRSEARRTMTQRKRFAPR
jgi:hypothetical protein